MSVYARHQMARTTMAYKHTNEGIWFSSSVSTYTNRHEGRSRKTSARSVVGGTWPATVNVHVIVAVFGAHVRAKDASGMSLTG